MSEQEWSFSIDPTHVLKGGEVYDFEASADQCKALKQRFGVIAVEHAKAQFKAKPTQGGHVLHVAGTLQAKVVQACVVSEAPVEQTIEEHFEGWFADPDNIVSFKKARRDKAMQAGEELQIAEEHEDPEPFIDGMIDVGELAAQHLSLALDPYPRDPEAEYEGEATDASEPIDAPFTNPFAKLKDWRDTMKS